MNSLIIKARKLFVDRIKIKVTGGTGGHGLPQYGGVGGKGGDVIVKGTSQGIILGSIIKRNKSTTFKAGNGQPSKRARLLGEAGEDLIIKAPLGVTIEDSNKQFIGDINEPKDEFIVALGGRGGDKSNDFHGFKGQERSISLTLKTISDAVLVGFPNAGKSSLLRVISRATPKVASYPFTTLKPNLGVIQYPDDRRITVADLPGLVEGAHRNIGLGQEFIKHMVRTRLLVFQVDINNVDLGPSYSMRSPVEVISILNKEIELYDDRILNKPAILVVSKIDTQERPMEKFERLKQELEEFRKDPKSFKGLDDALKPNNLIQFDAITPISSFDGTNIDKLKIVIRKVIDDHEEASKLERDKFSTYGEILPLENNRMVT